MKKFFGIIFILIGIVLIAGGVFALTDLHFKEKSLEGQVTSEFNDDYNKQNNEEGIAGVIFISMGIIFNISGIILVLSKSRKQKKEKIDLEVLKKMEIENKINDELQKEMHIVPISFNNELLNQLERLGKLKEQGLLTEIEFQEQKTKFLG